MAAAKVKSAALSVTHKCRNILAAGWEAHLNTIKADAKGSKGEIHTSRVHYMIQKGTPYLIVPENDLHNIVKLPIPPRVAMTGDVLRLKDSKVPIVADSLKKTIMKEHEASSAASHGVSAILSSAGATCRSRSEGLLSLLNEESSYSIFKFDIGSCVYIDSSGSSHNIELDSFEPPKSDLLMPFSAKLIDGINRSDSRRRALIFFCFEYFNALARDAVMLSIDHHGFDVLAKVPETDILANVPRKYHWKEFRFTFKEPAKNAEDFCRTLVELEEEVVKSMKSYSGLG
ncbi:hypothetical protein HU200_025039 [Digitaria exilis]|uniref:DUF2470 domain-containing protein n=1 Tax=Digitaria exilis TaxID=1010633 RepID=A0A835C3C1_9POAL|nr:hypothetical protein HU200_025039 [Digitaria exilis]CAB3501255.1 unnamed protein product [Digitaria exilis]